MSQRVRPIRIETGDGYWDKEIRSWFSGPLRCQRCGIMFNESQNIGRWECVQHAIFFKPDVNTKWPCCGGLVRPFNKIGDGCVRADHCFFKTVPWNDDDDLEIPEGNDIFTTFPFYCCCVRVLIYAYSCVILHQSKI
jgi:hypothetical protein